jgi:hypothetical protein
MTSSAYHALQFETRNVAIPRRVVKASLFCAMVIALSLVPFTVAAGPGNGAAVIGPSPSSTPYPCTSAGVQQAISDAVNHTNGITQSVVDASNCTSMSATSYNSEIYVGTPGSNAQNQRIKLILPANGTWTAGINDTSKYALKWSDGAMIYGGTGSGQGQPFVIAAGSGSNLAAVCGNDPTYGTYFHAEGFSCYANTGSTVQNAVIEIANDADESYLGHVTAAAAGTPTLTRILWVFGGCCSATFEDINAEASSNANTTPCVFGNWIGSPIQGNDGIHVSKLSCIHPGKNMAAMMLFQTGGTSNHATANSFRDIFMEQDAAIQDNGSPWVTVRQSGGAFPAADLLEGLHPGIDTSGSVRCVVDMGPGSRVNISNLQLSQTSRCAIYDNTGASGVWTLGAANSVIASYNMTPLFLGATTVGSLPAANQSVGAMFRVTDSTAISSEGLLGTQK